MISIHCCLIPTNIGDNKWQHPLKEKKLIGKNKNYSRNLSVAVFSALIVPSESDLFYLEKFLE
jgi:hypothetical protein